MKPTLLYISPFWPQRSGISEYSECLVWGLKKYYNITILTKNREISNQKIRDEFPVQAYSKSKDYSSFDVILYNFGNSPDNHDYMYDMIKEYPGYIILHDFTLYYLTVDHYSRKNMLYQKIYELEGVEGVYCAKKSIKEKKETNLLLHKNLAPILPLNDEILRSAKGIFVHSNYTKNEILSRIPNCKVCRIELVDCMPNITLDQTDFLREKYGWSESDFIIGAVGMIAPSKQNEITCRAVEAYNKAHDKKIKYVMIGEGDYVDSLLNENIIKTGFLENKEFFEAIQSCDVIFNLRYPYNGESSATLMQCMLMGKQCVVTDIGWFSELPDFCVKKVEPLADVDILVKMIEDCILCRSETNSQAIEFVRQNCCSESVAKNIYDWC